MQEQLQENRRKTVGGAVGVVAWKKRIRMLLTELLWGCIAWLLGQARLPLGTYPLGMALLCSSTGHTPAVLAGLILTSLQNLSDPAVYICAYLLAGTVRLSMALLLEETRVRLPERIRQKLNAERTETETCDAEARGLWKELFGNTVWLRVATAASGAGIIGIYMTVKGGFLYYDLFGALFSLLATPALMLLFSVAHECGIAWMQRASRLALLFTTVFSANTVTFLSLPLSPMIALFFTLATGHLGGALAVCITAFAAGIAYHPLYAPAFLLAGLVYLFLKSAEHQKSGILWAVIAMLSWSVYAGGAEVLLTLLPAGLLAGAVFGIAVRLFAEEKEEESPSVADTRGESIIAAKRQKDTDARFRGISDAFSSLSEVFYNLSDRHRRPGTLDLRRLCDSSFEGYCASCPNRDTCWGLEYSETLGDINGIISALHTKGRVTGDEVGEHLSHRCAHIGKILDTVNSECAHLTAEMLRNNRTEIFAMDYESAADIINEALEEEDCEYRFDPETEKKIAEYLRDAGVSFEGVSVYGGRRRRVQVLGADTQNAHVSFETLRSDLGELCSVAFTRPVFEVEAGVGSLVLESRKKLSVIGAKNNISADGGVSGDSVNLFSNRKDYFYALISDGMGSGKEAALTSGLCSVFLEKMLRAGNRAGTSLRMLNNMIRSRAGDSTRECSSTVDLLELDLITGNASFIKSGAAPSFVVRGNAVHRLQSGTVPLGIICTLDAQSTPFPLLPGDLVVMISDGILACDPDCKWLISYLADLKNATPEEIVYRICLHAAGGESRDDCSAIALKVEEAGE